MIVLRCSAFASRLQLQVGRVLLYGPVKNPGADKAKPCGGHPPVPDEHQVFCAGHKHCGIGILRVVMNRHRLANRIVLLDPGDAVLFVESEDPICEIEAGAGSRNSVYAVAIANRRGVGRLDVRLADVEFQTGRADNSRSGWPVRAVIVPPAGRPETGTDQEHQGADAHQAFEQN